LGAKGIDWERRKDVQGRITTAMAGSGTEKVLRGTKVMVTGAGKDKQKLVERAAEMEGIVQNKVNYADPPHVMVANDVLSEKYRMLVSCGSVKITVVTADWIHACWKEQKFVPYDKYRLGPFAGLVVCVSSLTPQERQDVQMETEKGGGNYSADLSKKCTHLLTTDRASKKYQYAVQWGTVHVVDPKWFYDSIKNRQREDESRYNVGRAQGTPSKTLGGTDTAPQPIDAPGKALQSKAGTTFGDVALKETSMPMAVEDPTIDLFMDGCRIHFAGFGREEVQRLLRLSRRCGATRYTRLHRNLTHIILGRNPNHVELSTIHSLATKNDVMVVYPSWLEKSALLGQIVDESEHKVDKNVLQHSLKDPTLPYVAETNTCVQDSLDRHENGQGSFPAKRLLDGTRLCVADTGFTAAEHKSIVRTIRGLGGSIVGIKDDFDYAVFPISGSSWRHGDRTVTAEKRVTFYWIESCIAHQVIIPFHRLIYRPISHDLPFKRATSMLICVSGYDGEDRSEIVRLLEAIGAFVSEGMKRRNTHLVLPWAEGQKYGYCQRWGVTPVTASWLFDSVTEGRMLPEAKYPPPARHSENMNMNTNPSLSLLGPTQFASNHGSRKQEVPTFHSRPSPTLTEGVCPPSSTSHEPSRLASTIDHVTHLLGSKSRGSSPIAMKPVHGDQTSPEFEHGDFTHVRVASEQQETGPSITNRNKLKETTASPPHVSEKPGKDDKLTGKRKSKRLAKAQMEDFGATQLEFSQRVLYSDEPLNKLMRNNEEHGTSAAAEDAKQLLRSAARAAQREEKTNELKELGFF